MKRFILITLALITITAAALLTMPGLRRLLGIDISGFVVSQIEALAAEHINPTLTLEGASYQFPTTVRLHGVRLTKNDTEILTVETVGIRLTRYPFREDQVCFGRFDLQTPVMSVLVDEDGGVLGWDDFVKTDAGDEDGDSPDPSEQFAVERVNVRNATFVYEDQRSSNDRMMLDGFNLEVDATRSDQSAQTSEVERKIRTSEESQRYPYPTIPTEEGWYHLETVIERAPLMEATLDVGFDIDSLNIVLREVAINTKLDEDNIRVLPPQIQPFLRKKNVQGDLSVRLIGHLDPNHPFNGPIAIDGSLTRASFGEDAARLNIPSLGAHGKVHADVLTFKTINGTMLGGTFEGDFEMLLEDMTAGAIGGTRPETDDDADAKKDSNQTAATSEQNSISPVLGNKAYGISCGLQLDKIQLQQLTSRRAPKDQLIGQLDLDVEAAGIVTRWPETLRGDGEVTVRNGRIASIPVISAVGRAMDTILLRGSNNDRMDIDFSLEPEGIFLEKANLVAGIMSFRARGTIGFDDSIYLIMNGGPLERMQDSMGAIGRAFGGLTDRLVRYEVSGPIGSPSVAVRPLGLFTRDPLARPQREDSNDRPQG
ncbi:MAG: hypothetical protein CMJ33_04470 [Phycisphaerae bacterium]|nr:hypothetical protein [Phycisphaerae bacterium]